MATSRIPGILDHRSVGENLNDGTLVRKTSPRPAYVGAYVGLNHGSLAARPPTTPHHRRKTLLLLQQGSNGDDVRKLQQLLNDRMDPSPHLKVDGIFGPQTKAVVIQFQRGARIIADGMLGRKTWFYLLNGKKIRTNPPAPDTNTIAGIFPRPVPVTTTGMIPVWQRPLQDRFTEVMRRTAPKLTGSLRREFEALLSPASLTIIGTTLGLWAAGHIFGVSEVVDMVLLIGGVAYLGTSVFTAAHELHDFLEITSGAADEKDLDTAASHLANAIAIIGVTAFTLLLAKIARSKGGGGDGVVGRDEAGSAVANSSPLPKSARLEPLKERPTTGELSSPESKEKSFFKGTGKSVNPNRLSRTPSEQTAWDIMNRQGRNPWAWDSVKVLLEEFRADVFNGTTTLTASHDRVTLFKKKDCRWRFGCWPSYDWLCAVERTGHMTRRKRKWLRASDDGQHYDGVAGAAWCLGRTIIKDGLPSTANDGDLELYARETFVPVDYVKKQLKKRAVLPRSLCGIIVEVNSKPWGVIVIDSSLEKLPDQAVIEAFYRKNAKVLGKLLAVL